MTGQAITNKATDWRAALRKNDCRTKWVITLFVLIYLCIGFIIDTFLYSDANNPTQAIPFPQAMHELLTFQTMPYATISMGIVAIIAILITLTWHNRIMLLGTQYKEITSNAKNLQEKQLFNIVEELKIAAGLRYMPKIYLIEAGYMNAFASGYSEKSAMVAITRGLLEKLERTEIQAVMAHELSHIKHHDVKLTLIVSVLSNIMLVAIDLLFYNMIFSTRRNNNKFRMVIVLLRYILPLITVLLMLYLSRTREYMADAGCIELMRDNKPLSTALLKIHQDYKQNSDTYSQTDATTAHENIRRAAYLYNPLAFSSSHSTSFIDMFSTHPSLEDRLAAIGYHEYKTQQSK